LRLFFSFFRRVRGRLLQAFGVRLQAFYVRRALRLDGGLVIGTRTAGCEKAQRENQKQELVHNVEAIGDSKWRYSQIATPLRGSQQSQKQKRRTKRRAALEELLKPSDPVYRGA
jgi:hypothetical protein